MAVVRQKNGHSMTNTEKPRCPWCLGDPLYISYHDKEWGRPLKDNQRLFELLVLEGAQAGLSWLTILKRREGYRAAFDGMDPEKIARYGEKDISRLMEDQRIIRNHRKIVSAVENAQAYLALMEGPRSLAEWLWDHVDGKPVINHFDSMPQIPASTPLSETISKELKKMGFSFIGPTVMYAFLQSAGLVNDHLTSCYLRNVKPGSRR
jgi:DNA-3-methyladenine glycosylase I